MDCRITLRLALLALACAGCELTSPWSAPDPKDKMAAADKETGKMRLIWTEQTKLKPETLVAYAHVMEQRVNDPNVAPEEREHLLAQARDAYRRALNADPKFVAAHLGLANLLEGTGNHEQAVASYKQALALTPTDKNLWFAVGTVQARNKEWAPALECFQKAVELDPENKQFITTLGMTLARAGRFDESFTCLRRVVSEAEAQCLIARMLHHMNQDDAARAHVQMALQANPPMKTAQDLRDLLEELDGAASAPEVQREPAE